MIQIFIPLFQKRYLAAKRLGFIRNIEKKRQSRVTTMIHRQETMSLLGFPIARYIDIEDSEHLLRAIRMTPEGIFQLMELCPRRSNSVRELNSSRFLIGLSQFLAKARSDFFCLRVKKQLLLPRGG